MPVSAYTASLRVIQFEITKARNSTLRVHCIPKYAYN